MKVLLIEDHRQIADIIFEYFEIKGYTLDWAADGRHGLELAENDYYDVIVLDIMLPHMDGHFKQATAHRLILISPGFQA